MKVKWNEHTHAGSLMEDFYRKGSYQNLKQYDSYLGSIRKVVKEELQQSEVLRHEFSEIGYVAKWRKVPVYDTDYVGLNEYLHDLGLLIPTARIPSKGLTENAKEELSLFEVPVGWTIGIHPNKKGRVAVEPLSFDSMALDDKLRQYSWFDKQQSELKQEYEQLKKTMLECPTLRLEKKITHEYGSITLKEKKEYDLQMMLDWLGVDPLINYARPDRETLEFYMIKGLINPSEIEPFRKTIDIRLDFIIQTIESEKRMLEFFGQKQSKLYLSSIA